MKSFDIIIIGSGPGGYVGAIRAAQLGKKVAIVESENLGGVCLNWGCIPTKALLKSAQVFDYLKHSRDYGIHSTGVKADLTMMVDRSRGVADSNSQGVGFLMRKNKIEVMEGRGSLVSAHEVKVEGKGGSPVIRADHIILATGARSRSLPGVKVDGKRVLGYRDALMLKKIPKTLAVLGSGAIGVEFAYFYHTLGSEVTLVEYLDHILPNEDREVGDTLGKLYKKAGMKILTGTQVQQVKVSSNKCEVRCKGSGGEALISSDVVLSATGVSSNIENLGLEKLGVVVEKDKVRVDSYYRTSVPGIYAIGDIVKGPALAHVASAEAILCVEAIAGGNDPEPLDYGNLPGCTYCQPEVASVGMTEKAARDAGHIVKVGKFPFSASGKAKAAGATDGFVKVVFDGKYGGWLGCHLIGHNVTELIAEVVVARKLETTAEEILKAVHPHPTMSEAIMEATAAAFGEVIHL